MNTLEKHLQSAENSRDQVWDEKFFKLLSETNLKILTDDPQQGPDGWPYLICETTDQPVSTEQKIDTAQKIIFWLSKRGIGLVINPTKLPYPDYIFSFGMLWSFRETGYFIKYENLNIEKQLVLDPEKNIKIGQVSAEYLPLYIRSIMKDFLRDQSIFDARILMISTDGKSYDLCFSLESLGSPPEAEHEGILEALAWFLPPHYTLAVVSEVGLVGFESL